MKSPQDRSQPPAQVARRDFLAGIGSAFGAMAINLDDLGRSLLVGPSTSSSGMPWPTTTASTSVTSSYATQSCQDTHTWEGWDRTLTYPPGYTWTTSYSYAGYSFTGTHTYTDTYFGSQTLTVYDTVTCEFSPSVYTVFVTNLMGSNGNYTETDSYSPTGTYVGTHTTSQSATYTTTTWWPWGGGVSGGGDMQREIEVGGDGPEPVVTLDCEHDILDPRTRRGTPPRLLL